MLSLESCGFGGGRLISASGSSTPHYYVTDHLGSVRVVLNNSGDIVSQHDYYPFGKSHDNPNLQTSPNRYLFNGKESQTFANVPYLDYGARMYDADIIRWKNLDPRLENDLGISPFAFCGNNPVVRIDRDGKIWDTVWDVGNLIYDVGGAAYNHIKGDHATAKTHWKDAGADLVATFIPFVPAGATKIARAANKAADAAKALDKATDAVKVVEKTSDVKSAMKRGLESEKRVLKDMGLKKNTKTMSLDAPGSKKTIPDAVDAKTLYEVKDVKTLSNTKQIQTQRQIATQEGKDYKIITGDNTHVSGNINPDEIIRRADLGPQQ